MSNLNETINPEALKAFRKQRRLNQQQLANKVRAVAKGCTKDTVSRWERGTSKRVRPHLREGLCKVLKVDWEQLTEPPRQREISAGEVKVTIGKNVRNALQLVAKRYDIVAQDVVNLAPLLFLIAAEKSLLARTRRLNQIDAAFEEANEKLQKHQGHLDSIIFGKSVGAEEHLGEEEDSINNRDIFGRSLTYDIGGKDMDGPFVHFIQNLVIDLPKDAVGDVFSYDGNTIDSYRIADDTLQESTGISRDDEQGEKLLLSIHCGAIDYAKCLRVKRDESESNYRQWLSDELARIEEENKQFWDQFVWE